VHLPSGVGSSDVPRPMRGMIAPVFNFVTFWSGISVWFYCTVRYEVVGYHRRSEDAGSFIYARQARPINKLIMGHARQRQ